MLLPLSLTVIINFTLCLAIPDMFGGKLGEKDSNCTDVNQCRVYMTRFLNQLLKKTNLKNYHLTQDGLVNIPIEISVDSSSLWTIQSFARNEQKFSWEELDLALMSIFSVGTEKKNDVVEIEMEDKKDFKDFIQERSYSEETIIVFVISIMIFFTMWLILHNVSIFRTFLLLSSIMFIIGFGITWYTEVQNAKIDSEIHLARMNGIPEECFIEPSFWNRAKNFLLARSDRCKDYHWANVKPINKIVISEIFVKTLSNMLMAPMPIIGEALGSMTYNYSKNLPLASEILTWIIFPLVSPIVFILFIIFLITVACGRSFTASLPFFSYTSHAKIESQTANGLTDSNNSPDSKKGRSRMKRLKDGIFKKPYPKSFSETNVLKDRKKYKQFFRQRSEILHPSSKKLPVSEATTSHTDHYSDTESSMSISETSDGCSDLNYSRSPRYKGQLPVRYKRYSRDKKLVSSEDKYF